MAVYQVGADGKAPKGLQVGDEVVTGGGTVKITGVNADGSYTHSVSNAGQTTKNYTGSYANGYLSKPATVVTSPSGKTTGYGENGVRQPANVSGNTWSGNGASGYFKTPADYAKDTTDYAEKMLASQSYDEFKHWQAQRENKAAAQGIDLSGGGGVDSNEALYQKWKENVWPTTDAYAQYQKDKAAASGQSAPSAGGGIDVNAIQNMLYGGSGTSGGSAGVNVGVNVGGGGGSWSGGNYDLSGIIRDQRESALEAELEALKGAFEKSDLALKDAGSRVQQEYDAVRNEVAGQNAVSRNTFNEQAVASGLNTGTSGQAALAQNSVLQRNLADIATKQADAEADIALERATLVAGLQSAIAQAVAEGEEELARMLYEEMVRVQELERADSLIAADREAAELELMLKNELSGGTSAGSTVGDTTNQTPGTPTLSTYDNEGLEDWQIVEMQKHFGATPDGKWGANSRAAAGNRGAKDAWEEYINQTSPSSGLFDSLNQSIRPGAYPEVDSIMGNIGTGATNEVYNALVALGIPMASPALVVQIADMGGIVENSDGSLRWANGWSASNYQQKMAQAGK